MSSMLKTLVVVAVVSVVSLSFVFDRSLVAHMTADSEWLAVTTQQQALVSQVQDQQSHTRDAPEVARPPNCTQEQLAVARRQLPPDEYCSRAPREQRCPITQQTKCPDNTNWLQEYYSTKSDGEYFVAVNIGCNKGFDALNLLRMGTKQTAIRKEKWRAQLGHNIQPGVCEQDSESDFPIVSGTKELPGEVQCVEPMPLTVQALGNAANVTGYDSKGFRLVQAALANDIGTVQFPAAPALSRGFASVKIGTENRGLDNNVVPGVDKYDDVNLFTLDEYARRYLSDSGQRINVLLVDVEGYDFDVLKGGRDTLSRVEYIEFEYNWKAKWAKQQLSDAIKYLDDKSFTCYWAGRRKLWRITDCWLDHYKEHNWANVGCVHRQLVPDLAELMEEVFLETLDNDQTLQSHDKATTTIKASGKRNSH